MSWTETPLFSEGERGVLPLFAVFFLLGTFLPQDFPLGLPGVWLFLAIVAMGVGALWSSSHPAGWVPLGLAAMALGPSRLPCMFPHR
jgi:hypothetical protein